MTIGAVTGLAAEATVAREIGFVAAVGGGTAAGTKAAAEALLARPVIGLVSFGIAGGLAPGLQSGALVLPAAVRARDGTAHWVDVEWHLRLTVAARKAGLAVIVGGMLGHDAIAATAAEKAALHHETSAVAVDLESHVVASVAQHARVPFVVLRAVADPAERDLPPAALLPLTAGGRPNLARILCSLACHPRQVPALLTLARETKAAFEALRGAGQALKGELLRP